ncbi:hypothetical protein [Burkholderia aenigmatica]|nr:hypothetical protein [Burkholderia aenigmatica]
MNEARSPTGRTSAPRDRMAARRTLAAWPDGTTPRAVAGHGAS